MYVLHFGPVAEELECLREEGCFVFLRAHLLLDEGVGLVGALEPGCVHAAGGALEAGAWDPVWEVLYCDGQSAQACVAF